MNGAHETAAPKGLGLAARAGRACAAGVAFGTTFLATGIAATADALFNPGPQRAHGDQAFDNLAFGVYMIAVLAAANATGYAIISGLSDGVRGRSVRRIWIVGALMGIAGFLLQLFGIPYLLLSVVPFRDRIPAASAMAVLASPGVLIGLLVAIVARVTWRAQEGA